LIVIELYDGTGPTERGLRVCFAQMLYWQEVPLKEKDGWKSITTKVGEQSVTTASVTSTPQSFATVWDLGWCSFNAMSYNNSSEK